jgi:opacity protein-like surface antigen
MARKSEKASPGRSARAGFRPLLSLAAAAVALVAVAGGRESAAQPFSDPGPGAGAQGGIAWASGASTTAILAGVHYRFRLTGGIGIEAAAGYREATYDLAEGGRVRLQTVPVTGALLLYPWTSGPVQPYALAGAGYFLVRIRGEDLPQDIDGTENQFGFLAGAGVEVQVSRKVSLFLDGRFTFLPVDTLQSNFGLEARYASVTAGVTYRY